MRAHLQNPATKCDFPVGYFIFLVTLEKCAILQCSVLSTRSKLPFLSHRVLEEPDRKCMIELDEHQKYLIRKTEHSFFSANRIPTIDAVYREVQNNEEIPNISRSKLFFYTN
jgi:hypothetical protein